MGSVCSMLDLRGLTLRNDLLTKYSLLSERVFCSVKTGLRPPTDADGLSFLSFAIEERTLCRAWKQICFMDVSNFAGRSLRSVNFGRATVVVDDSF